MRSLWRVGVLLLGVVATGATAAVPGETLTMLRQGKVRRAHRLAIDDLEVFPDDPDMHAAYAAVLQRGGRDAEALVAFQFAEGSEWYESTGIPMHATALARVGRSEESTALREEFEVAGRRMVGARLGVRTSQVEDHIIGGRPFLAVEAAKRAVEEFPGSPTAFASLTEAYLAAGDLDNASWALLRCESMGAEGSRTTRMARMRWHIAMEEYAEAWDISEEFRRKRMSDYRLWAERAQIRRLLRDPAGCLAISQLDRFQWGIPAELRIEGSRCAEELEDMALARELMEELMDGYQNHPHVRSRLTELGMLGDP